MPASNIFIDGVTGLPPTVALNSPADAGSTADTTPDLVFTGTDNDDDDVRYEIQIDTASSFGGDGILGYATKGGTGGSPQADKMWGSKFTTPASLGAVTGIHCWCYRDLGFDSNVKLKLIIVKASDLTIVTNGVSNAVAVPSGANAAAASQVDFTFASTPVLTASTDYFLMAIHNDASWAVYITLDAGSAGQSYLDTSNSYTTPTDPTDATSDTLDDKYSIWVTYTPVPLIDKVSGTDAGFVNTTGSKERLQRIDIGSYASAATYGTASYVTGSFTPPANSLLVVAVAMMGNNTTGDLGTPTISGGSLSYTLQSNAYGSAAWSHRLNVFTAPVGSSPSSMTITVDDDTNQDINNYTISVIAYTGYDTGTPIAGIISSGSTDIADGAETQTLSATPTADDETLTFLSVDADNTPNQTVFSGFTKIHDTGVAGGASVVVAARGGSTSTSVVVSDAYTTTGTYFKGAMISLIVKASATDADPFASGDQVTYTVQSALAAGTYYWRVRAKDPYGDNEWGAWATTRSFTISGGGGGSYTQLCSETITLTDTIIRVAGKVSSETITHTDSVLKKPIRTLSDTITLTDTLLRLPGKILTETITHTDSFLRSISKVLTETITQTDTIIRTASRQLTETITNTDTLVKTPGRVLSEIVTHTDTLLKQGGKILSETVSHTDTVLKSTSRTIVETITHTDTFTSISVKVATLLETITHTDSLLRAPGKVLTETISFTESFLRSMVRVFTETITLTDTLIRVVGRTYTETITYTDAFLRSIGRVLTETITSTDTLIKLTVRTFVETISHTDVITRALVKVATLTETITHSDTIVRSVGKVLSEITTLTDSIIKTSSHVLSETITLTAALVRTTGRVLSDTLTLTDSILRSIGRIMTETISLTATLIKTGGKRLTETITHTDVFEKISGILVELTETINLTDIFSKFAPLSAVFTETITFTSSLLNRIRWYNLAAISWMYGVLGSWYSKTIGTWKTKISNTWYSKNTDDWKE